MNPPNMFGAARDCSECINTNSIVSEVKHRSLGHVLHMDRNSLPHAALKWTPPRKRRSGRPLGNWEITVEEDMKLAGKTWHELSWLA